MNQTKEEIISFNQFLSIDMRVGTVLNCVQVDGSEKLLKLEVDFGDLGTRQILAGLAKWYDSSDLDGTQAIFVVNLEPRKMMGLESQGMIMAADIGEDEKPVVLRPSESVENGSRIR
ncbi:methionine--tRNA ligase [Patescibacteria group bacterium]